MTIRVNGEPFTVPARCTLEELLERMDMGSQRVAVEHNEDVVPRSEYAATGLQDGDRVEIIRAIGGG
ncbi:sulfur carrier protein ThiS [Spiribacter sp. 221]|uniref:Sulfur carrier protein ThiS n=1 Tax=Spiribacter insolitus TaxID=3122417 RepID=A0ABV3T7U8_9GAMM